MKKKHYAMLHILEILSENIYIFFKIKSIHTKDKKKKDKWIKKNSSNLNA